MYISHLSDVQTNTIGDNTTIWQFCVVLAGAAIGNNTNICSHCFIENDVSIGNNVTVKIMYLYDGVIIEDDVFIGVGSFLQMINDKIKNIPRAFKNF